MRISIQTLCRKDTGRTTYRLIGCVKMSMHESILQLTGFCKVEASDASGIQNRFFES